MKDFQPLGDGVVTEVVSNKTSDEEELDYDDDLLVEDDILELNRNDGEDMEMFPGDVQEVVNNSKQGISNVNDRVNHGKQVIQAYNCNDENQSRREINE